MANNEISVKQSEGTELQDRLIVVNRVSKVVKGGRRFGFSALVAVGDENGTIGLGTGKANDVSDSIRKAVDNAKRNLVKVSLVDGSIPHEVYGKFGAGYMFLKPATAGTGVIAGGAARVVLELAGVKNILTKCLGSRNAHNSAKATLECLKTLKTREEISALRKA